MTPLEWLSGSRFLNSGREVVRLCPVGEQSLIDALGMILIQR